MAFYLRAKKIDIETGEMPKVLMNEKEALNFGIHAGDHIGLSWHNRKRIFATVNLAENEIKPGEIGLFEEIWAKYPMKKDQIIEVAIVERPESVKALNKKVKGGILTYDEIHSIIADIVSRRLGPVETSYFVASSFARAYTRQELYYLTKSIAETGEQLRFSPNKIVVDKHSVGGLAGNRTTMVVVPIVAAFGLYIPKTSSRAITSPSGTADTMEVLAPVGFSMSRVKQMVMKNKVCMIWGGGLNIAPADDLIIQVTKPLSLEPFDKMVVSIMAKKVAMGIKYLIIDMPVGVTSKIPSMKVADDIEKKFIYLGKRFGIKVHVEKIFANEPVGRGVGPALESRDVLRVLQQKSNRPKDLEDKALILAGKLLEISGQVARGKGKSVAQEILQSGKAWKKMQVVIKEQGGDSTIDSDAVVLGGEYYRVLSQKAGKIESVDNKAIDEIARTLGAPAEKLAGIYLHKRVGQEVKKGSKLFTFYANRRERIELAKKAIEKIQIFTIS
jgi:AMP phosphorylase